MTETDYHGKGVWCVAEIRHGKLVPTIFELLTAGRALADALGEPLSAVVLGGCGAAAAAEAAAGRGAEKVYVLEHAAFEQFIDEAHAAALAALVRKETPRIILLAASAIGRSLASRASVLLQGGLVSDVTEVALDAQKRLEATHPAYGGNLLVRLAARRGPELATIRPMAFARAEPAGKRGELVLTPVDPSGWNLRTKFISYAPEAAGEVDLGSAEKIVSGGRGLGGPQGFELIRKLAQTLGAGVGASRATVDAGWIPYRNQVGLTGRTVRPRVYFACGISGQIQHLAGMSSSDVIVAINTDPDCPMMKLADFSVQGDLYELIPAVIAEIESRRGDVPAGGAVTAAATKTS